MPPTEKAGFGAVVFSKGWFGGGDEADRKPYEGEGGSAGVVHISRAFSI
jgi:hypothetical protein